MKDKRHPLERKDDHLMEGKMDLPTKELKKFMAWIKNTYVLRHNEKGKQAIKQIKNMIDGFDSNGFVTIKTMKHKEQLAYARGYKDGKKAQ